MFLSQADVWKETKGWLTWRGAVVRLLMQAEECEDEVEQFRRHRSVSPPNADTRGAVARRGEVSNRHGATGIGAGHPHQHGFHRVFDVVRITRRTGRKRDDSLISCSRRLLLPIWPWEESGGPAAM